MQAKNRLALVEPPKQPPPAEASERDELLLEADLGPDHEDVLAIKDVLDNLDADEAE